MGNAIYKLVDGKGRVLIPKALREAANLEYGGIVRLAVRGIKVVEGGRDGLFVSMPSRKTVDGYKEVCFPVTAEFRSQLHNAVMDAYQQALTMAQAPPAQQEAAGEEAPQEGQQMAGM